MLKKLDDKNNFSFVFFVLFLFVRNLSKKTKKKAKKSYSFFNYISIFYNDFFSRGAKPLYLTTENMKGVWKTRTLLFNYLNRRNEIKVFLQAILQLNINIYWPLFHTFHIVFLTPKHFKSLQDNDYRFKYSKF